jgi:hypothetical protein
MRNFSLYCLVATGITSVALATANSAFARIANPAPTITNQAAGSYQDPIDPTKPLTVYSDPITITMQEIAGITITPTGITRQDGSLDGGAVSTSVNNDILLYSFDIQNIGSDTTQFQVPNLAQVGAIGIFQKVQYFTGTTWNDVPTGGYTSEAITPNDKLRVRVVVKVTSGLGDLPVTLGKTARSGTAADTQNQLRIDNPEDIYTVDAANGTTGEYDGLPSNGTREAQATQSLRSGFIPEALATIDLSFVNPNAPFNPVDNTINFALKLNVADTVVSPLAGISPTDLTGANITLDGQTKNGILVSDAIPLGTKFVGAVAPDNNWIPVYYYSSTPIGQNDRLDQAAWSTTVPDSNTAVNVKRVGFFRSDYRMPRGTTVSGFQVKVEVVDTSLTQIYNIAQVVGTQPNDPNNPADKTPSNKLIFDESGDGLPNNYDNNGTPSKDANLQPNFKPGIVDPNAPVGDLRNPQTIGQAAGSTATADGEYILVPFKLAQAPSLKNSPLNQPTAVGPNNDQDDFTNKSTTIPGNQGTFDPATVVFTNTVINTADLPRDIKIVPQVKNAADLPNGTVVTLEYFDFLGGAAFKYQNGIFTPVFNPQTNRTPAALVLTNVGVGAANQKSYTVSIDLPAGTPNQANGYPVQLVAFVDTNNNNIPDTTEASNTTIDRVYTGFIQVTKESRLLGENRQPLLDKENKPFPGAATFCTPDSKGGSISTVEGSPGQYIEYCIRYKNISEPASGVGNKVLAATGFTIIENGTEGVNNWGNSTFHDPDTATSSAGTITYQTVTGTTTASDPTVVIYQNKVDTLIQPGQGGDFRFTRKVK